jgi:hypothetical protein
MRDETRNARLNGRVPKNYETPRLSQCGVTDHEKPQRRGDGGWGSDGQSKQFSPF